MALGVLTCPMVVTAASVVGTLSSASVGLLLGAEKDSGRGSSEGWTEHKEQTEVEPSSER